MNIKQSIGLSVIILGTVCLLFAGYVFVWGETHLLGTSVNRWEALVPTILGSIFFKQGISLMKTSS